MGDLGVRIFLSYEPQQDGSHKDGRKRKDCDRDIKTPWCLDIFEAHIPTESEQNHSQGKANPL